MKFKSLIVVLGFVLLVFAGCRYEDGPAISFRSVENRLKGEYDIVKFEKGGVDLTDSLKKMICYNKFIIYKKGDFEARGKCIMWLSWKLWSI